MWPLVFYATTTTAVTLRISFFNEIRFLFTNGLCHHRLRMWVWGRRGNSINGISESAPNDRQLTRWEFGDRRATPTQSLSVTQTDHSFKLNAQTNCRVSTMWSLVITHLRTFEFEWTKPGKKRFLAPAAKSSLSIRFFLFSFSLRWLPPQFIANWLQSANTKQLTASTHLPEWQINNSTKTNRQKTEKKFWKYFRSTLLVFLCGYTHLFRVLGFGGG